ncbi:nischarin-like [Silurus meridionalis]|uniref:nischarin-like n=1 Tax=Silurus meridionalis TaxID=175797 RepID=UPI001EECD766|nr:nischarin-like [Silurus meridionalis]
MKNVQTQNMTPFTPSQKVEPNKENAPAVNTVPAVEERTTVDEKPALPQVPAVEQSPAPSHVPAVEQSPAPSHVPAVEQSPALPQVPAVEQSPAPSHVPAVEQSPAPSHVPDVQDVSMAAAPQKRLTIYMLESADFEMQIQMAHDHLLPLVEKIHPAEANKISWMLIGSKNNFEIMNMISDPDLLRAKVDEMNMILKTGEAGVKSETKMLFGTKKKRKNKKKNIYL